MLCDTYLKWDNLQAEEDISSKESLAILYAALEWKFYQMFLVTLAGKF